MKVGDLVEHIDYGIGIVVDIVTYEQYMKRKGRPTVSPWADRFPLIHFTVFEPISFQIGDSDIKTQTTFIADQLDIEEGELEVISESR